MNMRKIIAVLAAMLMLCSIIPMGALVSAAAVVNSDFEDGTVGSWTTSSGTALAIVAAAAVLLMPAAITLPVARSSAPFWMTSLPPP